MKTMITIAAVAALLAAAGTAAAQTPQSIPIEGSAEAVCTLPAVFAFHSANAGANSGQFSGTTWTIPPSALAGAGGNATTGLEYAIRVRGQGFCNTSHTITVSSANGGLAAAGGTAPAPNGFANRRPLRYEAYWVASGNAAASVPLGPKAQIVASTPGQQNVANYVVSSSLAPPGNRNFDLRIGMDRGPLATPLIAGVYNDTVTVTLSPTS